MARRKYSDFERNLMRGIAENLRNILKNKGVLQKELSEGTELSTSVISDYLNEKTLMPPGSLQKISDYLKVKKSDIDPSFAPLSSNEQINSDPIANEKEFISKLDVSVEKLLENFTLTFEGRELSQSEAKLAINFFRNALNANRK